MLWLSSSLSLSLSVTRFTGNTFWLGEATGCTDLLVSSRGPSFIYSDLPLHFFHCLSPPPRICGRWLLDFFAWVVFREFMGAIKSFLQGRVTAYSQTHNFVRRQIHINLRQSRRLLEVPSNCSVIEMFCPTHVCRLLFLFCLLLISIIGAALPKKTWSRCAETTGVAEREQDNS